MRGPDCAEPVQRVATVSDADGEFRTLVHALLNRIVSGARLTALERLSGGATQQSWAIRGKSPDAPVRLVLRRGRPGVPRHELDAGFEIEAAVIHAAAAHGVPVPAVRHVLERNDHLGEGFVSDLIDGRTVARTIQREPALAAVRTGFANQCGTVLARIHAIPIEALPEMRRTSPADMIAILGRAVAADPVPRPVFAYALRWLRKNAPSAPPELSLVHGDFRLGNLIVDERGIAAVLDWEQTHLGDPMEDMAWLCLPPWRFGQVEHPVGGIGAIDDLLEAYRAAGGIAGVSRLHWWSIAGSLRWGVHCAEMLARFRSDDTTVERGMITRRLSENEIDLLATVAGGPGRA
jgi:aminoglycoside phosphotransferase (APT) family kinase protein